MTANSPFTTTRQRFLEKVETGIKVINNSCFSGHRLQSLRVSCDEVNGRLVVSVNTIIYCAKCLLIAIENFDVDADSEDYLNIWDYLKCCELPK